MIEITIERRKSDSTITAFKVTGHAEYAAYGNDIVCAGVSAVTFGTVNAIEKLTGCKLEIEMEDSGWFAARITDLTDEQVSEKLQLLLEAMVVMLETIQHSYNDYVDLITLQRGG